jgi:hypothetical protein
MVEWYWTGKPKYPENTISQCHYVLNNSHMNGPRIEPVFPGDRPTIACVSQCSIQRLDFLMVRLCSPWGRTPNFIHSMAASFADFRMAVSQTRERITLTAFVDRGEFLPLIRGQICETKHKTPHSGVRHQWPTKYRRIRNVALLYY